MSEVVFVPLESLKVSRANVRRVVREEDIKKLMENILRHGLLNPLIVRRENGYYGVICGRLRLEALRRLKEAYPERFEELFPNGVPVTVKELDDREAMLLSLSENLRQHTMTRDEVGAALEILEKRFGMSREEISRELQLVGEELERAIKLWEAVKAAEKTIKPPRPGRPPKKKEREEKISRTAVATLASVSRVLYRKGVINDPERFTEKLAEMSRGLSTKEIQILSDRLRKNPDVVRDERRLKNVIEDIKRREMVERIVALRKDLVEKITELSRRHKKTFDEILNLVIERGLEQLYR